MRRLIILLVLATFAAGCGALLGRPAPLSPEVRLDSVADKRAAFAQAYAAYRHGEIQQALPIFAALAARYPELADYHLYFVGVISTRLGHDADAEAALTRSVAEYPQSVQVPAAKLELGRLLVRTGRADQARLWLQGALTAPDATTAQEARLVLAEADESSGDLRAADAGFTALRREAPGSAAARAAKVRAVALRHQHPELTPVGKDLLEEARLLLAEQDYRGAKEAVEQLPARGGSALESEADATDALRVLADALYGMGETERALAVLRQIVDHYPSSEAAPAALFRRASILWNRDRDADALQTFEEFHQRYPHEPRAAEALYAIGRIHQKAGRTSAALQTFVDVSRSYPLSKLAFEAQWRIGWMHYGANDWSAAAAAFASLAGRGRSPQQQDEAAYWQARALEHAGRAAASRKLYHDIVHQNSKGYYALWAQRRLEPRSQQPLLPRIAAPERVAMPTLDPEPVADAFHLTRCEELKAAGVADLARHELGAIERDHGDATTLRYLLRAYQTVDGYAAALRLAGRLGNRADLSSYEQERLEYPLAFWPAVRREADAHGIDPLLVVALMRQESQFDPGARSPVGARGLMQLMPATAQRLATASGSSVDPNDLTEPELNLQLGVQYLHSLLDRFRDPLKAVAAYNGGEAAVEKWQREFADLDADEFVESITYRETRDYVKRVVGNYRTYQQLYGTPAGPSGESEGSRVRGTASEFPSSR